MKLAKDGITVFYDSVTKSLFMACGDKFEYLIGPFETQDSAFAAGRAKSRRLGWTSLPESEHCNAAQVA